MKTILFIILGVIISIIILFVYCALRLSSYISHNYEEH